MLDWLLGPRLTLQVLISGAIGGRMVRFKGPVQLRGRATVRAALQAAGRQSGVDLLAALGAGGEPVLLLNGERLELPEGLGAPVTEGAELAWLSPLAGG